jgi:PAS domain S-box-containing protein
MEKECVKILLIEDDPDYPQLIQVMLTRGRGATLDLECADTLRAGLERLAAGGIDVVLLDLSLPDSRGFDTFARMYAQAPDVPIMVLSGLDDESLAIEAVHQGAQDYLVKDWVNSNLLARSIRYAIERHQMLGELKQKTQELQAREAENRAILDAIPDLMFQVNKDGVLLDYRAAKDDGMAMVPGEFLGKRVHEVMPTEIAEQIMRCAEWVLQAGEVGVLEYQLPVRGDVRDYEARVVALAEEDKVLAIVRDITERKEIERMKNTFIWRLRRARLW